MRVATLMGPDCLPMKRSKNIIVTVLLALAAALLYSRTVTYDFVYYDDVRVLRDHPEVFDHDSLSDAAKAIFMQNLPREEPLLLRDVSWALDSMIWGFGNPVGYHLGNVLLHALVVALAFTFLRVATGRPRFALATTCVYLILGVHVEPLAWIMGRKDLMSAVFMLLALITQDFRLRSKSIRAAACSYVLTFLCLLAGLFSKISVLSFPGVLFAHAALAPYLRGDADSSSAPDWRRLVRVEVPLLVPMLCLIGVVFVWYKGIVTEMGVLDRGYTAAGIEHLWNLLRMNPMVWVLYLKQILVPSPSGLTVFYNWPSLPAVSSAAMTAASGAVLALLAGTAVYLYRRRKDLLFFFIGFFILMIPYMNLIYSAIWAADRYLYFSSLFLLCLFMDLCMRGLQKRGAVRIATAVLLSVSVLLNLVTNLTYQTKWRDGETLWRHHVGMANSSWMAYRNLGAWYYEAACSNPSEAPVLLRKMEVVVDAGIERFWPDRERVPSPAVPPLLLLKAIVQEMTGRLAGAVETLLLADMFKPDDQTTQTNLAMLYWKMAVQAGEEPGGELGRKALARYERYIELAFGSYDALPERVRLRYEEFKKLANNPEQ